MKSANTVAGPVRVPEEVRSTDPRVHDASPVEPTGTTPPARPEAQPTIAPAAGRFGRRATASTLALVVGQVLSMLLAFTALKIITQNLGLADYGLYSVAIAFTGTFSLLADFGVNAVTSREVARRPGEADAIVPLSIGLRLALSSTVAPLVLLGSFLVYPSSPATLHVGIAMVVAVFVSDAVRTVLFGYLTGSGRNYWVAAATVLQQTAFVTSVCIAIAVRADLLGVFASYLLASCLTTTVCATVVRKRVRIRPRASLHAWRHLLAAATSIGVIQVVNQLYLRVDGLLLSVLVGPSAVALYAVAYSVITGASVIPGFLMSSLLPNILGESHRGRELLIGRALGVLALLGSMLTALIVLAAADIVAIISSEQFSAAAAPMIVLGVATLFTFANPAIGFSAVALDVHHRVVWISVGCLLLNVVLNLILIPMQGAVGAAAATLSCELIGLVAIFVSFRLQTGLRIPVVGAVVRSASVIGVALLAGALLAPTISGLAPLLRVALLATIVLCSAGVVLVVERIGGRIRSAGPLSLLRRPATSS